MLTEPEVALKIKVFATIGHAVDTLPRAHSLHKAQSGSTNRLSAGLHLSHFCFHSP
jgi:hypothetical protein